jgi:hypothetical protein
VYHRDLDFVRPESVVLQRFLDGSEHMEVIADSSGMYCGRSNTTQRKERGVSWAVRATWGPALLWNTMTPLVSISGWFLLMGVRRYRRADSSVVCWWLTTFGAEEMNCYCKSLRLLTFQQTEIS